MSCCYFCKEKYPSIVTSMIINGNNETVCWNCYERHKSEVLEDRLQSVNKASDFKSWEMRDMSEAFWVHLGKYKKHPNRRSLKIISSAWYWACHEDHGLSNSFAHALDWCEIDLYKETQRTDLPDVYTEVT